MIDIFAVAGLSKPNIGILSDEFLEEVSHMKKSNLAVELLERLLKDEIEYAADGTPAGPDCGDVTRTAPLDPGRTDLYKMISRLPAEQLETARRFLRFLIVDTDRSLETESMSPSPRRTWLQSVNPERPSPVARS